MLSSPESLGKYSPIDLYQDDEPHGGRPYERRRSPRYLILILCAAVSCLTIGFISGLSIPRLQSIRVRPNNVCREPVIRREWRSLSRREKHDYIEAVQCLRTMPSRLGMNQSLYDDFPWVHTLVGGYSHDAAAFLAWHRYFLHVYERALREQCRYVGRLTYWDWSLDWEDVTKSPIWNSEDGFGGNGNASLGNPFFKGYCVADGPFAELEVLYTGADYKPHCLSRGFQGGEKLARLGQGLKPEVLKEVLGQPSYEEFNLGLEDGPHLIIPKCIRGDFTLFTAPYDPVFFLHHTQLDRMWWTWQRVDIERRQWEYLGRAANNSTDRASLADVIPMGGLSADIEVSDIMKTEGELLCYQY